MNINIVASSCNETNNKYIFSLLKNRDKTKNHIIIAPDRSQFSIEQRLFEETDEKCFFDVNVISLSRLSKTVLKNNKKNILSKQSGVALVKKILNDNKDKLLAFGKATNFMGFANSLYETICFYKSCFVSCDEIEVNDSNSYSNLKQKDIKLVYSEYEKYLQNDFTDSFNRLKLFADLIDKNTFQNTIFYFIEFDDFTRLMYEIIIKLARFSDGIYLSCLYGKDNNNSNIFNNKVYYDLVDIFKSEGLYYNVAKPDNFADKIREKLTTNLLSYSPEKFDLSSQNIFIKSFDNITDEVKFVIADIYSKVLTGQTNLSDLALVVPSISTYKQILIRELSKYDLPFYIDENSILSDNNIIRLVFNILKLILGDYKSFDFSVVLKSPILNFNESDVNDYDNYIRRIGAVSDMCLREENTENNDIKNFINFIKEIRVQLTQKELFSEYIEIVKEVFNYILNRAIDYTEKLSKIESRIYNQVVNKFENINNDVNTVFGNIKISFEEFVDIYKTYFESTNISMPPVTSDTLFIADFSTSYLSTYNHIYILGNNEGVLPSQKLDNGLITDEELSRLPNAKKLTPTVAMLNARKVLKLFDMIFKYKSSLNLSYVNSNSEGKQYPNNLVLSLVNIGDIVVENYSGVLRVVDNNINNVDENNIIFNNLTYKVARQNLVDYLYNWDIYNSFISYRQVCSSLYDLTDLNTRETIQKINTIPEFDLIKNNNFFSLGNTSVSEIENFNKCPYMHFVKYGLHLQDNQNTKIKSNEIGIIIHNVLSLFIPKIIKQSLSNDDAKLEAKNLLDKELEKEQYKDMVENIQNAYVLKALYRELDRIVEALIKELQLSNFVPSKYECKFDKVLNINGINVKGFIDRIDVKDNEFIIIDYKTGDNHFDNYNDVYSGKKLQLLVYAKAYELQTGMKPNGVFYLPISNKFGSNLYRLNGVMVKDNNIIIDMDSGLINPNYSSPIINIQTTTKGEFSKRSGFYSNMCLSREDFDYLLNFAIKQVEKTIANIMLGDITPRPLKDGNKCVCNFCEYKALCNYDGERDNNVIAVESIERLKELEEQDG